MENVFLNREGQTRDVFLYRGRTLEEWLPELVERIADRFDPLRIVLFGSVARGETGYDSDLDLLVVFEHVEWENKRNLMVEVRKVLADLPVPKDIIVTDLDEISRRGHVIGTILYPALREGKTVYERS